MATINAVAETGKTTTIATTTMVGTPWDVTLDNNANKMGGNNRPGGHAYLAPDNLSIPSLSRHAITTNIAGHMAATLQTITPV